MEERMKYYKPDGNILILNDKKLTFPHNIVRVEEFSGIIVILLLNQKEGDGLNINGQPLDNVLAIDMEGNTLWTIKDMTSKQELFVAISKGQGNVLEVISFFGIKYVIDPYKPEIVERKTTK
jgi:hypothetical protein